MLLYSWLWNPQVEERIFSLMCITRNVQINSGQVPPFPTHIGHRMTLIELNKSQFELMK